MQQKFAIKIQITCKERRARGGENGRSWDHGARTQSKQLNVLKGGRQFLENRQSSLLPLHHQPPETYVPWITHTQHTHRYTRGKCNKALLCARPFSTCSRSSPYSTSPPPTRNIRSRLRNFVSCSPCVVHFWKGGKWVEMWEGTGDLPRCKHHHIHYYDSCCHN